MQRMTVDEAQLICTEFDALSDTQLNSLMTKRNSASFAREYVKAKCLIDFWWFMKFGIAYPMKHYYEPLHGNGPHPFTGVGLSAFLQDWTADFHGVREPIQNKFVVMAREHCKTQEATIAHSVWEFARNPNERMLLRSHVDPKAYEILGAIKDIIDNNTTFKEMFPWVRPKMERRRRAQWAEDRIILEREDIGVRTASIEAYGVESDPTGGHYTKRKYDDFETLDATYSELLREKMLDVFRMDDNLGTGGCQTTVVGTPYHPRGLIAAAIKQRLQGLKYDIFYAPCTYKAFDQPISVSGGVVLLGDRETFRLEGQDLPTVESDLNLCQAKITLFSPMAKDTVIEVREITWNDGTHFRVNRPIPETLGQPFAITIGNEKPTAPNRFTLDSSDIYPENERKAEIIVRQSLHRKRIVQGPFVYSCQMDLNPIDPSSKMFDISKVKRMREVPAGPKLWFRTCDFATPKETGCFSALLTGCFFDGGLLLTHLAHGHLKPVDILLELFLGHLRVQDRGGELEWTSFEEAAVESVIGSFLPSAQRDPLTFFRNFDKRHRDIAEMALASVGSIYLRKKFLTRGGSENKPRRISGIEPMLEAGQLYILEGMENEQQLVDELADFSMEGQNGPVDCLDCLADMVREGRPPRVRVEVKEKPGKNFQARVDRAKWRHAMSQSRGRTWRPV